MMFLTRDWLPHQPMMGLIEVPLKVGDGAKNIVEKNVENHARNGG
jgi:hypothetical protein